MKKEILITKLLIMLTLLSVCTLSFAQKKSIQIKSTEILPGNKVTFRIYAPNAKSVNLSSDDKWEKINFKKDNKGIWEGSWDNVPYGAYRYHFIVDGVNVYDPASPLSHETTAILKVIKGNEFYAMKNVPHGAISHRYYYSDVTNSTRRFHVWTPAGYEKSNKKLPVLYLIHGGGDTDNGWTQIGCAGQILDNLYSEGKIKPMIVVMPNGSIEISPVKGGNILDKVSAFNKDLMNNIIPFVEKNYRVKTDPAHRAIMGLSFGGLETLEAITNNPTYFQYIGILSSGWWISKSWEEKRGIVDNLQLRKKRLKTIANDLNKSVRLLYFTQGGPEDLAYTNGMATIELFKSAGIHYKYSEMHGGHTWKVWRKNLHDIAPLLFK